MLRFVAALHASLLALLTNILLLSSSLYILSSPSILEAENESGFAMIIDKKNPGEWTWTPYFQFTHSSQYIGRASEAVRTPSGGAWTFEHPVRATIQCDVIAMSGGNRLFTRCARNTPCGGSPVRTPAGATTRHIRITRFLIVSHAMFV